LPIKLLPAELVLVATKGEAVVDVVATMGVAATDMAGVTIVDDSDDLVVATTGSRGFDTSKSSKNEEISLD
jgi:hypothetical protein